MSILKQPDAVSSVLKTFGILEVLCNEKNIGISELAQRLMMSKSTVYRFLQTMKSLGYVEQDGETEHYSVTIKLFELGSCTLQNIDLIEYANKEMLTISSITHEALHLGQLDDDSIIYTHKIDSLYNLRMQSRIGKRNPLYSTALGKVLLADLDKEKVRDILKNVTFIPSTIHTHENSEQLIDELDNVRKFGFGEDNEEQEIGLRCLAVPIYNRFDCVIAGLSISLPTIRFTEDKKVEYIKLLHNSAAIISAKLGCKNYPKF